MDLENGGGSRVLSSCECRSSCPTLRLLDKLRAEITSRAAFLLGVAQAFCLWGHRRRACGSMPLRMDLLPQVRRGRTDVVCRPVFLSEPFSIHRARRPVAHSRGRTALRYNREREIIAVVTFVARLEIIAVDRDNPPIGQVAEGAAGRIGAGVAD